MKRLFYQIKFSSFCKKIENEIKMLDKIEKNAIKEAEEIRRMSYQNYLKQKEKGLLTKEYFEIEYKNLEDIIFNRIQISSRRRTEILKNLTEENFKKLKINPLIVEDLRKYTKSNDDSPFKAREIPIDNNSAKGSPNSKNISDFLNENFSVKNSDENNTVNYLTSNYNENLDVKKSENKNKKKEVIKLDRNKLIKDKSIYSILRIDENEQILEKKFSKDSIDKSKIKAFDSEGRDKEFIEFFEKKINKEFAEAQTKVEEIKLKNIKKELEEKLELQNIKKEEGEMLSNPNRVVKIIHSRKNNTNNRISNNIETEKNNEVLSGESSQEKNFKNTKLEGNKIPENIEFDFEDGTKYKSNSRNEIGIHQRKQDKDEIIVEEKINIENLTNKKEKKDINHKPITEESLIDKYLREFAEDEELGNNCQKIDKIKNNFHKNYMTDKISTEDSKKLDNISKSVDNITLQKDEKDTILHLENLNSVNKPLNEKKSEDSINEKKDNFNTDTQNKRFSPLTNKDNNKNNYFNSIDEDEYDDNYNNSINEKENYDLEVDDLDINFNLNKNPKSFNLNTNSDDLFSDSKMNRTNSSSQNQKPLQLNIDNSNNSELFDNSNRKFNLKTPVKDEKINKNKATSKNQIETNEENDDKNEQPNLSLEKITQINLRGVNLKENYLIKPTAKSLPLLKKEIIYNHDQLQILTSLKTIEFKIKNIPKLIDMLSIIRRKKKFKNYDLHEIANTINFISNYISAENNTIPASYIVNFVYSLSEMQNFDETKPSLSNDLIVYEILDKLVPKLNSLDNRSISNLLFALQRYQISSPKVFNFTDFLDKIEELVVKKFSSEAYSHICITQAVTAYSKCQAGSEEFYRIFADLIYAKKKDFQPKEISIVLYSYSNNINCNEKLLLSFEEEVLEKMNKFNSVELCNIARAYEKKKVLDDKLKRKLIDTFVEKHENVKMLDLSYLYKILADENEKKFLKYSHSLINSLSHDIDAVSLVNFMSKAEMIHRVDKNLLSLLKKITIKLIDKKHIKGFELKKIYEYIKDLPFDGKYNTFVENVVRQLEKIKYY